MSGDAATRRWTAARVKARELKVYPAEEEKVLALIYYLIATQADVEVDSVSLRAVRYRLDDVYSLQQDLAPLVDGTHQGASGDESAVPRAAADVQQAWKAVQYTRHELLEDTLPSDMIGEHMQDTYRETPENIFEHAARGLRVRLDRMLLKASGGGIHLSSTVEVTAGAHAGRTGYVRSVTWPMDHEQRTIGPAPASLNIEFSDPRQDTDIASDDLVMLPEWDRKFVVVHAGEPFPTEWNACVLLADPDQQPSWQQETIDALRERWRGFFRLVVLVPQQADGSPMSDEHAPWADQALAWADEIIARVPTDGHLPPRLLAGREADARDAHGRLTLLLPDDQDTGTGPRSWAHRNTVPTVTTADAAATTVLDRIGKGRERKGGFRQVPLLVARSSGFTRWHLALGPARKALVDADIQWIHREDSDARPVVWWAMRARIRHADHRITTELLVSRATVHSVVAYRPRPVWTDSEVVLVESDNSLSGAQTYNLPEPRFLRLPTVTMDLGPGGTQEQGQKTLESELGISVKPDRLRSFHGRHDSSLLAAERVPVAVELTDEELAQIRRIPAGTDAEEGKGPAVICRVADLLAEPLCDWATIGVITRAITPTDPPASGDFYNRRS